MPAAGQSVHLSSNNTRERIIPNQKRASACPHAHTTTNHDFTGAACTVGRHGCRPGGGGAAAGGGGERGGAVAEALGRRQVRCRTYATACPCVPRKGPTPASAATNLPRLPVSLGSGIQPLPSLSSLTRPPRRQQQRLLDARRDAAAAAGDYGAAAALRLQLDGLEAEAESLEAAARSSADRCVRVSYACVFMCVCVFVCLRA